MARLLLSLVRFARLWAALRPISAADCNRRNPAIAAAILERQHSPFAFRLGPEFVIEMKHVTTISQEGGERDSRVDKRANSIRLQRRVYAARIE
jgi:hypothetical protein